MVRHFGEIVFSFAKSYWPHFGVFATIIGVITSIPAIISMIPKGEPKLMLVSTKYNGNGGVDLSEKGESITGQVNIDRFPNIYLEIPIEFAINNVGKNKLKHVRISYVYDSKFQVYSDALKKILASGEVAFERELGDIEAADSYTFIPFKDRLTLQVAGVAPSAIALSKDKVPMRVTSLIVFPYPPSEINKIYSATRSLRDALSRTIKIRIIARIDDYPEQFAKVNVRMPMDAHLIYPNQDAKFKILPISSREWIAVQKRHSCKLTRMWRKKITNSEDEISFYECKNAKIRKMQVAYTNGVARHWILDIDGDGMVDEEYIDADGDGIPENSLKSSPAEPMVDWEDGMVS